MGECFMASDLILHFLSIVHKNDVRLMMGKTF